MSTDKLSFDPQSLAFLESQYLAFCDNPESVDPAWKAYFQEDAPDSGSEAPRLGPSFSPSSIFNPSGGGGLLARCHEVL